MVKDTQEQSYLERLRFDPKLLNGPIASYLKNFRLTWLLILSIVFLGIAAYTNLPQRLNPEVKIPIVNVVTILPGAGPEDVETLVTVPLENKIQSLEGLDTLSSVSQNNVSVITAQFTSVTDRDKAKDQVQSQVDSVTNLPEDAQLPTVTALDFENQPVWEFALTTTEDIGSLQRYAKRLKEKLEDNPKISEVKVRGLEEQEIVVQLEPEKLSTYGLNPLTISNLLRVNAKAYPAGTIVSSRNAYSFTITPTIDTVEDIRAIRINANGSTVTLGSIATIEERSKLDQNRAFLALPGEKLRPVVTFSVYKSLTSTITAGAKAAEEIVLPEISKSNERFTIKSLNNTAEEISTQFSELVGEFRATIILVFVCLFIFLGLKQAIISSFTVPLTFLASFVFMQIFGMSINFLSLFAFLLALGLLVDDTIVVISAMTTYYRTKKFTPLHTGLLVWKDTIVPIWSTTITTIWSFVPLLLATGIIGEFIKPIPIVVTVTMISSTAIAVLITLPIMILILKPQFPQRVIVLGKIVAVLALFGFIASLTISNVFFVPIMVLFALFLGLTWYIRQSLFTQLRTIRQQNFVISRIQSFISRTTEHGVLSMDGLGDAYRRLMQRILASKSARRKIIAAIVIYAVVGFMLVPFGFVKNEFFPKTDSERLFVEIELPPGTVNSRLEQKTLEAYELIKQNPYADFFTIELGQSAPSGFSMGVDNSNKALITLHFPPKKERNKESTEIAEDLRKSFSAFTGGKIAVAEVSGGPPAGSDLQIELLGNDLGVLDQYANKIIDYLNSQPGATNVTKSINPGTSAITFVPDPDKVARAGVPLESIGLMTRIYGSGFSLDELQLDATTTDETEVRFTFGENQPTVEAINRISLQTPNGSVPLLSLGTVELRPNPTLITRTNGKRTMSVSGSVRKGYSTQDINKGLESFAATLALPTGYSWQTGGVNEENAKSVASIIQAMGVSALLILVTMVIQFKSFRQAAIVLIVIPLAVSSVFYAFALTGTPLSFPALIGILSLFGIVVTNSMFIVDKINLNQREGMPFEEAIADSGASRLEPIILTKLSTVLGLLPITIADPLWRGLGGAIISGLLIASSIMLLFIPVLYFQLFQTVTSSKR